MVLRLYGSNKLKCEKNNINFVELINFIKQNSIKLIKDLNNKSDPEHVAKDFLYMHEAIKPPFVVENLNIDEKKYNYNKVFIGKYSQIFIEIYLIMNNLWLDIKYNKGNLMPFDPDEIYEPWKKEELLERLEEILSKVSELQNKISVKSS